MAGYALEVKTIGTCWIQVSHKLNNDEYFRKVYGNVRTDNREAFMFHRLMWMHTNNQEVPEGHDIDHKCHNRACFNPEHLQAIPHGEHQAINNSKRYRVNGKLREGSRYK